MNLGDVGRLVVTQERLDVLKHLSAQIAISIENARLYNEMERIILEESPWIFLYYNTNTWLVQPNVHGLKATNPLRLPLEYVKKS